MQSKAADVSAYLEEIPPDRRAAPTKLRVQMKLKASPGTRTYPSEKQTSYGRAGWKAVDSFGSFSNEEVSIRAQT